MTELPEIKNRSDAEKSLAELRRLQGLLDAANAQQTAAIQAEKQKYDKAVKAEQDARAPVITSLTAEINLQATALGAWAKENRRVEFGDSQSLQLPDGTLSFKWGKRSVELLSGWDWVKVLKKMGARWAAHIRIKREVDLRQILIDSQPNPKTGKKPLLTAEKLRTIGLRIEQTESFEVCVAP